MPWPVRSNRLATYRGTPAANVEVVIGTVPAGKTWLVKDWSVFKDSAGSAAFYIKFKSGGVSYVFDALAALASGTTGGNAERNVVLTAGEQLVIQMSTATLVHVQVSGAQLG